LESELRRLGVERMSISYFCPVSLQRFDLPPFVELEPNERVTGWVVVSTRRLMDDEFGIPPFDGHAWLEQYEPVSRAGEILIYYIPPSPS
jgi:hypothetical protein